ncbi:hypothetical protein GOP47_0025730 [Adiantum capillus-veneris]|uniref:Uncharacterized protein n=1 Tax=Adiantum capillus-veneris TaxID=13818 RepID=A0A9D4Z4E2_ADICA|nr:hypothetical protein GOP47_0025730 [Adiantum capillus-veneris]
MARLDLLYHATELTATQHVTGLQTSGFLEVDSTKKGTDLRDTLVTPEHCEQVIFHPTKSASNWWYVIEEVAKVRVEAGSLHHLGSGGWASFEADFWSMIGCDPTPYEREYASKKGLNALMDILSSRGGMNPIDMLLGRDETFD